MSALQAIIMALLQGVTELFPVSSLGHAVILPRLLNWGVDLKAPDWLAYLVVMHLGTSIALFAYFWRDWLSFLRSLISAPDAQSKTDRRTFFYRRPGDHPRRPGRLRSFASSLAMRSPRRRSQRRS